MYEGYGHALHEGIGCGAVVITVDRPPMNEFGCPTNLYVTPYRTRNHCLATFHIVAASIYEAAKRAIALGEEERAKLSAQARKVFLKDNEEFAERFSKLLGREGHVVSMPSSMRVAES
jgi:hypothetical protein